MKYEFTGETKVVFGITLKRIKYIATGEIGGWIEKEDNLSHFGHARVSGDARVFGDARVSGNAQVFGNAWVFGNAQVFGDAQVSGDAQVFGDAQVSGDAQVKKSPINIIGLPYQVTITETHMSIGCKIKTHNEWRKFTEKEAAQLEGKDFYQYFRHTLLGLMHYQARGK